MGTSLINSLLTSFFATLGFGVLLHAPSRALLLTAVCGMVANGCYWALGAAGLSDHAAIFLAAVAASLLAEFLARRMKMAATVFITLSIIPLVPGLSLYRAMAFLAQGESNAGLELGVSAMISFLMIALGIGMGSFLIRLHRSPAPAAPAKGEGNQPPTMS
jgi:uncharacterized membrane protein YjjB (DUF3815 family)